MAPHCGPEPVLPEPAPGLAYGASDDDVRALWAQDCPMCEGRGYVVLSALGREEREPCPNCGGSGGAEIPF